MENPTVTTRSILGKVAVRALSAFIVLPTLFFLPAGTFAYWEAWVYLAVLLLPMLIAVTYFLIKDPAFMDRRMRGREKVSEQRKIIALSFIPFILSFILPGLDHRFGWSSVPAAVVIAGNALVLLGYGIIVLVFRENRFASRIVEVEQSQKVISSGPYSIVRHPMYVGTLLIYLLTPIALGSYWALIPAVFLIPVITARIISEESVLLKELPGYEEYTRKVPYRLLPRLW